MSLQPQRQSYQHVSATVITICQKMTSWCRVKSVGYAVGGVLLAGLLSYAVTPRPTVASSLVPSSPQASSHRPVRLAQASGDSGAPVPPTPVPLPTPTPAAIVQRIAKLQYRMNPSKPWQDLPKDESPIVAYECEVVGLRAVKLKPNLPWPRRPFLPTWMKGEFKHWGEAIAVSYEDETPTGATNIVTATCGNTLAARIRVRAYFEILCYPTRKRAEVEVPGRRTTPVEVTAEVRHVGPKRRLAPDVPVLFTARYKQGEAEVMINGPGEEDDRVKTDAASNARITLRGITTPGQVDVQATTFNADGTVMRTSNVATIEFVAR